MATAMGADSFSAPPSAPPPKEEPKTTSWSIPSLKPTTPPPSATNQDPYANEDFSKYTSKVYDSSPGIYDRLDEAGFSIHPRVKNCFSAIKTGAQLGGAVGGIFGLLSGTVMAVQQRNVFVLPIAAIGGAMSFGFFLGCGMIIRCDEIGPSDKLIALHQVNASQFNSEFRHSEVWKPSASQSKWAHIAATR